METCVVLVESKIFTVSLFLRIAGLYGVNIYFAIPAFSMRDSQETRPNKSSLLGLELSLFAQRI